MSFKLKKISSLTSLDDICYPFNLQSSNDLIVHRTKLACEVVGLNIFNNNLHSKMQLSSIKTPKPTENIHIKNVNERKIFGSCDLSEKNFIMLNSNYFPDCTAKNTHYLKSLMGPYSERSDYVLACLTSAGIIDLYKYNPDNFELEHMKANLSEMRQSSLKLSKEIVKFNAFYETYKQIAFVNFEWSPVAFDDFKILIAVTKSDHVIFYRIQNDEITQEMIIEIQDVGRNRIKWIDFNDEYFLLVATSNGNLIRYVIDLQPDGSINSVEKIDEIQGNVNLPISNIIVDYHENSTIVLCTKTHSLEIFHIKENETKIVLSQYIDLTITGVEICDNLEYVLCTLNSKVYFLKLNYDNDEITLSNCERLEITSDSDDGHPSSKYAFYGISTSRNNILVYISCYPTIIFDHLINKQPVQILVNLFTKYDPFQILMNNRSLKLTDYGDCVEAIRFIGSSKLETLAVLEQINYEMGFTEEFIYYLKIQLMVVNSKLMYYHRRSNTIVEIVSDTKSSIIEIIHILKAIKLLKILFDLTKLNDLQMYVIRSKSNILRRYVNAIIEKEPFKSASEKFKPIINEILEKSAAILTGKSLMPETCEFCEEVLESDSLECKSNHKMKRCIVTSLLISLDCNNFCRQCKEGVTTLEILNLVLGNAPAVNDFYFCPFCDTKLTLCE